MYQQHFITTYGGYDLIFKINPTYDNSLWMIRSNIKESYQYAHDVLRRTLGNVSPKLLGIMQ